MANRTTWKLKGFVTGLAALLTVSVSHFEFSSLEAPLYDLRMRSTQLFTSNDPQHPFPGIRPFATQSTIIMLDDDSLDNTPDNTTREADEPIAAVTKLTKDLASLRPKAIAFLLDFNELITSPEEKRSLKALSAFADAAKFAQNYGVKIFLGNEVEVIGENLPPTSLRHLPNYVATIHQDGNLFAQDKVTRKALFSINSALTLHAEMAKSVTPDLDLIEFEKRHTAKLAGIDAKYFLIDFFVPTMIHRVPFPILSSTEVLDDANHYFDSVHDRVVFIGKLSSETISDYNITPFDRNAFSNPKLITHATIFENLTNGRAIDATPKSVEYILTFILSFIALWIVFSTTPALGLVLTTFLLILYTLLSFTIFSLFNIWIHLSQPFVACLISYYLFVPYRLMAEYKKRWQFQRQSELLKQVEELKSNFMSLVTHDLKTPVARIQGMAELLQQAKADPKIVTEIFKSTEELSQFISSILELTRVESSHLQLNISSKDINKIIEDCVEKFRFKIANKNIQLVLNLEPLFPAHIDVALVSKVVANLIDNAIKYSPDHSKIIIHSKESTEKQGFVEIWVEDEGFGIASNEMPKLFTKFYRPKEEVPSHLKSGTGLGLYLSKYFVALHRGTITVSAKPTKGTIFKVFLPFEQANTKQKQSAFENIMNRLKHFFNLRKLAMRK